MMPRAVRASIRASVSRLRHGSVILEGLIRRYGLVIAGAEYSLETGVVEFMDVAPEDGPERGSAGRFVKPRLRSGGNGAE